MGLPSEVFTGQRSSGVGPWNGVMAPREPSDSLWEIRSDSPMVTLLELSLTQSLLASCVNFMYFYHGGGVPQEAQGQWLFPHVELIFQ